MTGPGVDAEEACFECKECGLSYIYPSEGDLDYCDKCRDEHGLRGRT